MNDAMRPVCHSEPPKPRSGGGRSRNPLPKQQNGFVAADSSPYSRRGMTRQSEDAMERSEKFWNPYLGGIALGLVLLTTFLVMGKGLGASGAANRFGIFLSTGDASSLDDWLV